MVGKLIEKWVKLLKEYEQLKKHPFIANYFKTGAHSIVELDAANNSSVVCRYSDNPELVVQLNLSDKKVIAVYSSNFQAYENSVKEVQRKSILNGELPAIIDILQRDIKMLERFTKLVDEEDYSLEDRVSALEENVDNLLDRIEELNESSNDLEDSTTQLRNGFEELSDDLADLEREVEELRSRMRRGVY